MPQKRRILCVGDDSDADALIQTVLGLAGYDVVPAGTLADGLRLAAVGHFALLIIKEKCPDGRGVDFVRGLRAAGSKAPVIVHSDDVRESMRSEALEAGADLFLGKCELGELVATVRRLSAAGQ